MVTTLLTSTVRPTPTTQRDVTRIGELLALRREHIGLRAGTVSVKSAVVDVMGQDVPTVRRSRPSRGGQFSGVVDNDFATRVWAPAAAAAGLPTGSPLHDLRGWVGAIAARHGATTTELRTSSGTPPPPQRCATSAPNRNEIPLSPPP
jgi:hypothetical protein